MIKIYVLIFVIGIVGIVGYGAKYYYDTTQATIATLRENNAQLEVAVQTATASLETIQADVAKMAALNKGLQEDLQKAEAYGDELRGKLSRMNLVVEALKDAADLEGRMNNATAELWREFMSDTGNDIGGKSSLPEWLQSIPTGTEDKSGNQNREDNSTSSSKTETTTVN